MPVRPRRRRTARVALTPRLHVDLTLGPCPLHDDSDELLMAVYAEHRRYLLSHYPPDRRPWAWWRFEADVPDDLRATRPMLYRPSDRPSDASAPTLEARRQAWLHDNAREHA